MWGGLLLEISFLTNFNTGFNNTRSDILIHLTQWQYWWWFWFSYLWSLYLLLLLRVFRFRLLKFKPRLATTLRPHGKWGDVIVCLIPVSWCINIISNSNFILRMIEWQAESSIFTLRIRGRQWYWVYKYDLKILTDLISTPKNVGRNKWQTALAGDLAVSDDFLHILQLRAHNRWVKKYWTKCVEKTLTEQKFNFVEFKENNFVHDALNTKSSYKPLSTESLDSKLIAMSYDPEDLEFDGYNENFRLGFFFNSDFAAEKTATIFNKNLTGQFKKKIYHYNHENFEEVSRWTKRSQGTVSPVRLIKYPVTTNPSTKTTELFRFRFNNSADEITHKPASKNNYLVLKQKRYKPLKNMKVRSLFSRDSDGVKKKQPRTSDFLTLSNKKLSKILEGKANMFYKFFKLNKKQAKNIPLPLWKRLLRTKKTLVLPAQLNLAVITNSFDVIHSWFIPGLGIKLDCVPGRATHHVLHVDNVGFYYGQCAEICGRYHHHMPIRMCALPFEHFLIWWQTFGLPKVTFLKTDERNFTKNYNFKKFSW